MLRKEALGDRLFVVDVGRLAEIHAKKSDQPVYVYRYAFRGDFSLSDMIASKKDNYGVSHADDVCRIFEISHLKANKSAREIQMTANLLDIVHTFATNGVPKFDNVLWSPVIPGSPEINYLEISGPNQAEMKSCSDFGQKSFWDNLGFIENERYSHYIKDEL